MIGRDRVCGLVVFLATPVFVVALALHLPGHLWTAFAVLVATGVAMLFWEQPARSVGIGLIAGSAATFAALVALIAWIGSGVD